MIEVQVPKDISGYETPFLGPFTARQLVCVVITGIVEYIYYLIIKYLGISIMATDDGSMVICIGIIIAVPILYFAAAKPYGMNPEIYIYHYLIPSLIAPKDRPYATKLTYDSILEEIDKKEEEESMKSGKQKEINSMKKKKQKDRNKTNQTKVKGKQYTMYA